MPRPRKYRKLTAEAVVKALTEDNKAKYFIQHGDGYCQADMGRQLISPLIALGADNYKTGDETDFTQADSAIHFRFTSPRDYQSMFDFDQIIYPGATATTIEKGSMPEGSYCQVLRDTTELFLNNSSSSTAYTYVYECCPRRQITDGQSKSITEYLYDKTAGANDAPDTYAWTYWDSSGSTEVNKQYHIADSAFTNELTPLVLGVTPYDNPSLVQDYTIRFMGMKVLEPGENHHWKFDLPKYRMRYNSTDGELLFYDKHQFRMYLMRVHGEPVSVDIQPDPADRDEDVKAATWSSAKVQWTWINKIYWDLPPVLQYGQGVTGQDLVVNNVPDDETDRYLAAAVYSTAKQILAVAPTDGTVPGVTPVTV